MCRWYRASLHRYNTIGSEREMGRERKGEGGNGTVLAGSRSKFKWILPTRQSSMNNTLCTSSLDRLTCRNDRSMDGREPALPPPPPPPQWDRGGWACGAGIDCDGFVVMETIHTYAWRRLPCSNHEEGRSSIDFEVLRAPCPSAVDGCSTSIFMCTYCLLGRLGAPCELRPN